MEITTLPADGFLRANQLLTIVPISKATLWGWVKSGKFPKPVKLGPRTTAWDVVAVREWMEKRTQEGKAA